MKKEILTVIGIVILFLGVGIQPAIANNDDTTPPVTYHTYDPPKPDGLYGWYVSDVNVTLTATDDISGVNVTYYRVDGGEWEIYTEPFTLSDDGDPIIIGYYSVDNAGNVEIVKHAWVYIDQTEPDVSLTYEVIGGNIYQGWEFEYTATCSDDMSGMERVEFYINNDIQETVYGSGPDYLWTVRLPGFLPNTFNVRGLIYNLEINEDYVKFNALIVIILNRYQILENVFSTKACGFDEAGNMACDEIISPCNSKSISPGIYLFKRIILQNNYRGYIGNNFIFATFNPS